MLRAVVFDFGGVFMRTVDYSWRHAWDERLGLAQGSVERVVHGSASWRRAQLGQTSLDDYWADVAGQLHITPTAVAELAVDFFQGDVLDRGLVEYTESLRRRGHPVALLSNDGPALPDKLRRLGIAELFDPLVVSAQIGVMKPDAGAYQAVLAGLGCAPGEAVFIDDMPANVAGAQAIGMLVLRYTTLETLQAGLEPLLTG